MDPRFLLMLCYVGLGCDNMMGKDIERSVITAEK